MLPALALFIALLMLPAFAADASGASETYSVEGYVIDTQPKGNMPLEGVTVTIRIINTDYIDDTDTDPDGFFSVSVPSSEGLRIKFTKEGYTLRACPNVGEQADIDGYLPLSLAGLEPDVHNAYRITSGANGMQAAVMSTSYAVVTGVISYAGGQVIGADVVLISSSTGSIYNGSTDSGGRYSVQCPTGEYYLKVSRNGFVSSEPFVITASGTTVVPTVILVQKSSNTYFGLGTAHVLMIASVLLGITFSASMFMLARAKGDDLGIIDDTHVEEEADDDEIPVLIR